MDIRIPEVGESVREAVLAKWFKKHGEPVQKDEPLCEIETDKITLDLNADASGVLSIEVAEGTTVAIGRVVGSIAETGDTPPTVSGGMSSGLAQRLSQPPSSPSVRREMREHDLEPDELEGSGKGGRITLNDLYSRIEERAKQPPAARPVTELPPVLSEEHAPAKHVPSQVQPAPVAPQAVLQPVPADGPLPAESVHSEESVPYAADRDERRPMSAIRRRIAERLVAARQQTAMLTTFNEADMSAVNAARAQYRDHFLNEYGMKLGYMPFFVAACCRALEEFPAVNASIDGNDIVYHHYCNIGVAIGAEKGLVVPVLRSAEAMRFHQVETAIKDFGAKISTNQLLLSDLEGGTFSISNGGVYGSMLSTPLLNPPQSAVLGMHAIQDRPVARDGAVVVRPMMYLALSYDHRIIDGREAVGFLKRVVQLIEEPQELLQTGVER